jgi:hypothetical protein
MPHICWEEVAAVLGALGAVRGAWWLLRARFEAWRARRRRLR